MQGPFKENTIIRVDVYLVDAGDGYTPEPTIAWNDAGMTVKFQRASERGAVTWNTKVMTVSDWLEQGDGHYQLRFTAAEVGTINDDGQMKFDIVCTATRHFTETIQIVKNLNSDIANIVNSILLDVNWAKAKEIGNG